MSLLSTRTHGSQRHCEQTRTRAVNIEHMADDDDDDVFDPNQVHLQGAHASMLRGTVASDFDVLLAQKQLIGRDGKQCYPDASVIAGAFRRSLEVIPSKLVYDTSTRAVTVQTATLFCDLRISAARPALEAGVVSFDELPIATLAALVRTTHCFAGYSYIDTATTLSRSCIRGEMCSRLHGVDWQPMPRHLPNRWRIQPQFAEGGWVEWSARHDRNDQSEYIEYWRTLGGSRDGPLLALRRRATAESSAAYFLVSGDHWSYIADRPPEHTLPVVTPGEGGHPADRGRVEPLVAAAEAAGDKQALLGMLSMECHYGRVRSSGEGPECAETSLLGPPAPCNDGRMWWIVLSTMPWREGTHFEHPLLHAGSEEECSRWEIFDHRDLVAAGSPPPPNVFSAILAVLESSTCSDVMDAAVGKRKRSDSEF